MKKHNNSQAFSVKDSNIKSAHLDITNLHAIEAQEQSSFIKLNSQSVKLTNLRPLSRSPLSYKSQKGITAFKSRQIQPRQYHPTFINMIDKDYFFEDSMRPVCTKLKQLEQPSQNNFVNKILQSQGINFNKQQEFQQTQFSKPETALLKSRQLEYFQKELITEKDNQEKEYDIGLENGIIRNDIPTTSYMFDKVQYVDSMEVEVYPVVKDKQWF